MDFKLFYRLDPVLPLFTKYFFLHLIKYTLNKISV